MEYAEIRDAVRIEMVQTAVGCPEACLHCGAYQRFRPDDLRVQEVAVDDLRAHVVQPIECTDLRLIDLFAPFITTDVNTEPLRGDNFAALAEHVHATSGGRSRVCAISHGMLAGDARMLRRLQRVVALMKAGIVPLFVVSMDYARNKGRIGERTNIESYRRTLDTLREALPYGRVTISLQGDHNQQSPLWIGRTAALWDALREQLQFSADERARLVIDSRSYTRVGRAEEELGVTESEDCDVIPDPEFVAANVPRDHLWRGMIRFDGSLVVAPNRPGRTYGDSVNPLLWQPVAIGTPSRPLQVR